LNFLNILRRRWFLFILLSTSFYAIIAFYSDYDKLVRSFQNIQVLYIPAIVGIVILSLFLKSIRQRFLLGIISTHLSIKESFLIFNAGQSLLITPGGFGSLIRTHFLKEKFGHQILKTAPVFLVERYYDIMAISAITLAVLIIKKDYTFFIPITFFILFLIIILLILRNKLLFQKTNLCLNRIPIVNKFVTNISNSHDSFLSLTTKNSILITLPFSIICWLTDAVIAYLCFSSFHTNIGFLETTWISFASLLLGSISLLPGGIGVIEISMLNLIVRNGINLATAFAIVAYVRLFTIWITTFIGFMTTKYILRKNSIKT